MASELQFTRTAIPRRADSHFADDERDLGGQWEWCWAVPLPYRVVAAPRAGNPMPAAPSGREEFMDGIGYWASLQSFLTFSFGWTRHDRGLMSWIDDGMPDEDPRLELVRRVWAADGLLERYIEWCVRKGPSEGPIASFGYSFDATPARTSPEWDRRFEEVRRSVAAEGHSARNPDGLHLEFGEHIAGPARVLDTKRDSANLAVVDQSRRRAVITSSSVVGWYQQLSAFGEEFPLVPGASWRVDVYVKQIGFLGTYRRSWQTGMWFAGQHRYHVLGN